MWQPKIEIIKEGEFGYNQSIKGLSLNKYQSLDKMPKVAETLSTKDYGHNKFMEAIYTWWMVKAPRYWWQEADTYRMSTKQSQSSWYIIKKQGYFTQDDFEYTISDDHLKQLNEIANDKSKVWEAKSLLPEGYLQKRLWCMSYKTLRNIIMQRRKHPMPHWPLFVNKVIEQVEHPELLQILGGSDDR